MSVVRLNGAFSQRRRFRQSLVFEIIAITGSRRSRRDRQQRFEIIVGNLFFPTKCFIRSFARPIERFVKLTIACVIAVTKVVTVK